MLFLISDFRLNHYRLQLGHHSEVRLREELNAAFKELHQLSHFSDMTRDELRDLDFSPYRFLG